MDLERTEAFGTRSASAPTMVKHAQQYNRETAVMILAVTHQNILLGGSIHRKREFQIEMLPIICGNNTANMITNIRIADHQTKGQETIKKACIVDTIEKE